jgi:hypothetical protein
VDVTEAVFVRGLSWRRFVVLLQGLSQGSWWNAIRAHEAGKPPLLEGSAVDAYFVSQRTAGAS